MTIGVKKASAKRNPKYVGRTLKEVKKALLQNPEFALEWDRQTQVAVIGKIIRQVREQAELTQDELAHRAGTTQSVISRLESGDPGRRPTTDTLARIAIACGRRLVVSFN